eukprot:TRINITY_DN25177_c0_g3_i1.p1 TRINITY_DN25177_c0_g3~~TRINITY_DN25177_c0_g3_i1.p1  ORF type:complete len:359 (+),score=77.45 TRINITY_DN25177_c0_g3_i1:162-1238(+)
MMMRMLGRIVGSATAGASKVPATPDAHCSVNASPPASISKVSRIAQSVSSSHSTVPIQEIPTTVQIQEVSTAAASVHEPCAPVEGVINPCTWELDDWEIALRAYYVSKEREEVISAHHEEEDPQYRRVFEIVPTREEVEEAVSDLKDAVSDFNSGFNASHSSKFPSEGCVASEANSVSSPLKGNKTSELGDCSDIETSSFHSKHWKETALQFPHCSSLQHHGSGEVSHAFKLLESNADVQDMVMSLASDHALWDAVMKNEKVASFRKQLEEAESRECPPPEATDDAGSQKYWWDGLKQKVFEYMDKIKDLVQEMFGVLDKKASGILEGKASGIPEGQMLRSSVMLSLFVLLVVVLKRA